MEEIKQQMPDKEKQRQYKKFSPEHKWLIIKPFLEIITSSTSEIVRLLPSLSVLSATLLIVATLNPSLIPLGDLWAKIILSILLVIIPFSLLIYIDECMRTIKRAAKIMESYTGKNPLENIKHSFVDKLEAWFPVLILIVYFFIIFILLYKMWGWTFICLCNRF